MSLINVMNSKRVQLVWDNHLQNISDLFSILHDDDYLVDATLFCKDGYIKTHKLVLSACSPYFKQVFQVNPCKHPTIILREVFHRDMTALIEYMYKGVINVPSEHLTSIIKLARDLKIKGFDNIRNMDTLSNDNNNSDDLEAENLMNLVPACILTESNENISDLNTNSTYGSSNHKKRASSDRSDSADTLLKVAREEPITDMDLAEPIKEEMSDSDSNGSDSTQGNMNLLHHKIFYTCSNCKKKFATKREMKNHKRTHVGKPFTCDFCQKGFSRTSHLIRHRRVHTGERPFTCKECGKTFARQDKLKLHIRSSHEMYECLYEPHSMRNILQNERNFLPQYLHPRISIEIPHSAPIDLDPPMHTLTQPPLIIQQPAPIVPPPVQNVQPVPIVQQTEYKKEAAPPAEKVKRGRGRPRKYPPPVVTGVLGPKRGRGRPRKEEAAQRQAQQASNFLPFGDLNYLTVPTGIMEPLVEIRTDTATDLTTKPQNSAEPVIVKAETASEGIAGQANSKEEKDTANTQDSSKEEKPQEILQTEDAVEKPTEVIAEEETRKDDSPEIVTNIVQNDILNTTDSLNPS